MEDSRHLDCCKQVWESCIVEEGHGLGPPAIETALCVTHKTVLVCTEGERESEQRVIFVTKYKKL